MSDNAGQMVKPTNLPLVKTIVEELLTHRRKYKTDNQTMIMAAMLFYRQTLRDCNIPNPNYFNTGVFSLDAIESIFSHASPLVNAVCTNTDNNNNNDNNNNDNDEDDGNFVPVTFNKCEEENDDDQIPQTEDATIAPKPFQIMANDPTLPYYVKVWKIKLGGLVRMKLNVPRSQFEFSDEFYDELAVKFCHKEYVHFYHVYDKNENNHQEYIFRNDFLVVYMKHVQCFENNMKVVEISHKSCPVCGRVHQLDYFLKLQDEYVSNRAGFDPKKFDRKTKPFCDNTNRSGK